MRRIFLMVLAASVTLFSQNVDELLIKQSPDYYWGEGQSQIAEEARDNALEQLIQSIAVRVQASFRQKLRETGKGLEEQVEKVLQTHALATLKNVHTQQSLLGNEIRVFAYINKQEVAKIFAARKKLVYDLYRSGLRQEQAADVAQALKHYYFALLLLRSVPAASVTVDSVNLTLQIPQRINDLINSISFNVQQDEAVSDTERRLVLGVQVGDKPVSMLDFTFWDGSNQVNVRARDGRATLSLYGSSMAFKALNAALKYNYYESRKEIQAINDLWEVVVQPEFKNRVRISLKQSIWKKLAASRKKLASGEIRLSIPSRFAGLPIPQDTIAQSVQAFQTVIQAEQVARPELEQDAFLSGKLHNFIKYGRPALLADYVDAALRPTWHGFEVRRIPVVLDFPTLHRQTTEYIVLDTDSAGRFTDFNAALNKSVYNQFVENDRFVKEWKQRQTIIKFIEKYRTAYLARNLSMINQMFADNALIIVGRILKTQKVSRDAPQYRKFGNQPDIAYLRFTKQEYLARQKAIFKDQSDLLIEFSSLRIMRKEGAKNIYGVELRQNYASTGYADEGYLFLLIDFNHEDPLIYVRTWQPEEWRPDQLINAANFVIH